MKKAFVIVGIVAALGGGGAYFFGFGKSSANAAPQAQTAKVERGLIRLTVASTGRVVSNQDVDIKCKASGEIIKLPFDVSDKVKEGDLLLELDPKDQQRILTQAQVSLDASQAKLAVAKQNLVIAERTLATDKRHAEANLQAAEMKAKDVEAKAQRVAQLLEDKLASQEEYDTAETAAVQAKMDLENCRVKLDELKTQEEGLELSRQNVKLAEAQVQSDGISLQVAQDRLSDTRVVATKDGVVSVRTVQTGQIIASAVSNVGGGTTILTLSDLSRIFVVASVDESDIGRVKEGQTSYITADAFPGKTFEGKVVQIATKGTNTTNVVTFEVKIEITSGEKNLLKPEMTTNVEIVGAEKQDTLIVPVEGVMHKGKGLIANILKSDGTTEERTVETGISDGYKIEIVSGLQEGETVTLRNSAADSRWNAQPNNNNRRPPQQGLIPGNQRGGRR